MLVTTSRPAGVHDGLAAGLCSRLSSGLSVPLLAPGVPARRVLLRRIADMYSVPLSEAAIDLLAAGPAGSESDRLTVPQLNHAIVQLGHAARVEESTVSIDEVRVFLQDQAHERQPTFRLIAQKVAKYFSVTAQQLRGPSRRSQVVRARGVAMLLARNLTGKSLAGDRPVLWPPRPHNRTARMPQDRIATARRSRDRQGHGGTVGRIDFAPITHVTRGRQASEPAAIVR